MTPKRPPEFRTVPVGDIRLDERNPRLPEDILEKPTQAKVLEYLSESAVLDELAISLLDNGYFVYEPLYVVKEKGAYVAIEGNRRLATLKILLHLPPADDSEIEFVLEEEPKKKQLDALREVPCFIARSRDELRSFLGFRHIGGLRTWNPEAKARYLLTEVEANLDRARESGHNVFSLVAREVGSNAQGVRNPYIAIQILLVARSEFGLDIAFVQRRRFGVWVRCMNAPELREFIGFNGARTYEEVQTSLTSLRQDQLAEVLGDLTPSKRTGRAVLGDSRDVTVYSRVLANTEAHRALRQYEDLQVAKQVVEHSALPRRVQHIADSVSVILSEVQRLGPPKDLLAPSEELFSLAKSLRTLARAEHDSDD
jgi:hypothetical protein